MRVYKDFEFDNTKNLNNLTLPIINTLRIPPQQRGSIVYGTDNKVYTSNGLIWSPLFVDSGEYVPEIAPNNYPHTIDAQYKAFYTRVGNIVTVSLSYLMNPTNTSGNREVFSDVVSLPSTVLPTAVFSNQFQVTGQITCNLGDDSNNDYGHGVVFSLTGDRAVEVFYSFASTGATDVYVSVSFSYTL
jgi:hypothetical protein